MTDIVIKRTAVDKYQLEIDGSIVQSYQLTQMTHPWDWAEDAKNNGASESEIQTRDYDYIDAR